MGYRIVLLVMLPGNRCLHALSLSSYPPARKIQPARETLHG
jgi:hypothetical protein